MDDEKSEDDISSKSSGDESGRGAGGKGTRNETPDTDPPQENDVVSKPTKGKSRVVISDEE